MYQLFFMITACNLVSGLYIAAEALGDKSAGMTKFRELFSHEVARLILAGLSLLTGLFTLLNWTEGTILILGDLIPSLYALFMGFSVLITYYKEKTTQPSDFLVRYDQLVLQRGTVFGLGGILIALIHFLIPSAILL